ncbi:hypothetical protein QBC47DRAFT_409683 [Echria macrotheca]|uniref:Pheromone receptor n=1 Tax=Echria macrotheca TaxID=438768 RepID=A0AAJ0BIF0_9PEZI|nr:hypothetical protein QBC47DRAFT_409683 [Echria macrotheca]
MPLHSLLFPFLLLLPAVTGQQLGVPVSAADNCSFPDMQSFFTYALDHGLNLTAEVERCQNLCILTYGVGNPDLSGIGMMYSYTFQVSLTILLGPLFRIFLLLSSQPWWHTSPVLGTESGLHKILSNPDVQLVFWEANGFIVFASAVATLVRMRQSPTIFEVAQMQVLMFMQLNSLLIIFFCLLHPVARWWQRFFQFLLGFGVAMAALYESRLNRADENNWYLAGLGCVDVPAFKTITPIPFPSPVVFFAAVICVSAFLIQSLSEHKGVTKGNKYPRARKVLRGLEVLWGLFVSASLAAMVIGLVTLWRQRFQLQGVAGDAFEDHIWGFGQVAALFTWIPIPVEMSYRVNDWLKDRSKRRRAAKEGRTEKPALLDEKPPPSGDITMAPAATALPTQPTPPDKPAMMAGKTADSQSQV